MTMRQFGLIGHPLGHSFSRGYFTEKFSREGITDCEYLNFPLESLDGFPALWRGHPALEGLNVTIPHKEGVLAYLDGFTEVVRETGACNCIRRTSTGLHGHNTDVIGFVGTLGPQLLPHHDAALVLGTGGASKAVMYVLRQLGIPYRRVTRHPQEAGDLSYAQLDGDLLRAHRLIVNTTPLGMHPHVDTYPDLPYEAVTDRHLLYDLVYNPPLTEFLWKGAARGAAVCNGADMLRIQAEESWRIWNA